LKFGKYRDIHTTGSQINYTYQLQDVCRSGQDLSPGILYNENGRAQKLEQIFIAGEKAH
jgi:hypothetical protein